MGRYGHVSESGHFENMARVDAAVARSANDDREYRYVKLSNGLQVSKEEERREERLNWRGRRVRRRRRRRD